MKVTILGTGAACPGAGEACSGFLVEEENTNLLIDCGTGVLSNLQKSLDLSNITDIVITHMHADHFFDLIPYCYALYYGLKSPTTFKPRLYLPPDGSKVLYQVISSLAESNSFVSDSIEVSEYKPEKLLQVGNLSVQFVPVYHYIPTCGLTITNNSDTKEIVYSADSGLCEGLSRLVEGAGLFICNIGACLDNYRTYNWGHLTPEQAGVLAKEGGVRQLLLSHLWAACDRTLMINRASQTFGRLAELAESCRTYEV
ncbi:MBL fold metallo-hydrolase [Chloroflexota bacterium]